MRTGRQLTFESHHRRKDGSLFPVEVATNRVEFEGKEYSFAYVLDITQRKAAEQALRDLNTTLEARVREEVAMNREKDHLLIQQSRLAALGEIRIGNIAPMAHRSTPCRCSWPISRTPSSSASSTATIWANRWRAAINSSTV